ncbi:hypothetical protein [Paraburkholderia silvatlantica]|uniref:hypothetical protein n=1 Tax=Paraburkholderia silvatlantica TaxID=321895 RepID=UPI00105BAAE3|nr:hypothetical protein [Paraburkholderia silvatlantica]TDQ92434.1 hypothetical protein C7412_112210 [Paraburkholderia silvatlantica]
MKQEIISKRKLAVLLTGVPRSYERCLEPLKFLVSEWDVSFFAVVREEFASADTLANLAKALPGMGTVVVPAQATKEAVAKFKSMPVSPTVVMMWHELAFATQVIEDLEEYELVFRTRFDVFFHRQFLPEIVQRQDDVYLPVQMSWSGANDMLCLANPRAFSRYAATYERLMTIVQEGVGVPEAITSRSLALAGLDEQRLDVLFILYRDVLFSTLSDEELRALAHIHPALSTYKLGSALDTPELRARCLKQIRDVTNLEARYPLNVTWNTDANFYPTEIDARDGRVFRWMALHAHMNVALPCDASTISFLVHFHIAGWDLTQFSLLVDGTTIPLVVKSVDEHRRLCVEGSLVGVKFRRPWSKLGFSSRKVAVPSQLGANPNDHRSLSVAIGAINIHIAQTPRSESVALVVNDIPV